MKKLFGILMMIMSVALMFTASACTQNTRLVKNFGGEMTVNLTANAKLVNATWKDNQLWILTRNMRAGESVETYTFMEKSDFGVTQGTINIVESGVPTSYMNSPTPAYMDKSYTYSNDVMTNTTYAYVRDNPYNRLE